MVYESGLRIGQLKTLLPQFYAEEGRAAFIAGVVGRMNVPQEYVDRTILFYESKRDYDGAKNVAIKAGMQKKAATLEQRIHHQAHDDVALIDASFPTLEECAAAKKTVSRYEQLADNAPVEIAVDAIDAYRTLGDADEGVRVALQYGLFQKAIQIRERDEDWRDAGAIAEAHGLYERAGIYYEKAKEPGKAGDCFTAEVRARKEKRKNSKDFLVAAVSYLTKIFTPEEENLMVRAAGNYIAANWQESAEKVLGKIKNKKRMYVFFENQGDFKGAEAYAASHGDGSRQQFYKTIDILVDPKIEAQEKKQREERTRNQERIAKIREIKQNMRNNLRPYTPSVSLDPIPETVELYHACRSAAEIALGKYGISYYNPIYVKGKLNDYFLLDKKFVETGMLAAEHDKTMRTLSYLSQNISEKIIRGIAYGTYATYYKQAADFIDAMETLVAGKTQNNGRLKYDLANDKTPHIASKDAGLLEKLYSFGSWFPKEITACALAEGGFFYVKKWFLVPAFIGTSMAGECAYIDAQIAQVQLSHQSAKISAIVSTQNNQKVREIPGRFCGTYAQDTTLVAAK